MQHSVSARAGNRVRSPRLLRPANAVDGSVIIRIGLSLLLLCLSLAGGAAENTYLRHRLEGATLVVENTEAAVRTTPYGEGAFEVHYTRPGLKQLPSFALAADVPTRFANLSETRDSLEFSTRDITARIEKSPFAIAYFKDDRLLFREESGFFAYETVRGFRFALAPGEKILGGGERVLGMDRRGHRLALYNKPDYGYSTESAQMYFSVPAVLSNRHYMLVFDNSARGNLDIGKSEADVLQFDAVAGRTAYIVVAGDTYPEILEHYTEVTGRQPLPPRWAFGNFASRFGYHSERETREVVKLFRDHQIPLDAVILDIYWFGPDIQGHMGNLDWDREAFPTPEKMMADFRADGINTLVITEPFILSSSRRWQEAVEAGVLASNVAGQPKRFDFYFGNSGIIDVFDDRAAAWFWDIYRGLAEQGVAGVWGDLGEPEAHPADTIYAPGTADEIHNAYGHKWAELVFRNHEETFPDRRPVVLMRSGFAGSQRFGILPWTGDVSRSWGGLQSQVELALQMGLLGLGYIHSDLGGFAGGETFDQELYIRWLQYGVFQPLFRPHAQEHIPAEPVFHDERTREIARRLIELRYRLLPYLYTLAWENATTGMPFARPLFFTDESDPTLMDYTDAYLWGDAFLVSPVVQPGRTAQQVRLPAGVWFDFFRGDRYQGAGTVTVPLTLETFPVLVRAGSFIPMAPLVQSTRDYSSASLELHYFDDLSVKQSSGRMYEDDGRTHWALEKGAFELLHFNAVRQDHQLTVELSRKTGGYPGMPVSRDVNLVIHNWQGALNRVRVARGMAQSGQEQPEAVVAADRDEAAGTLTVRFSWDGEPLRLAVE
jgi:oligosaccharide 4-alpha-D-glucosyltransferase